MQYSVLFTLRAAAPALLLLANCSGGPNPNGSSHAGAPSGGSSQGGALGNVAGHDSGGTAGSKNAGGAGAAGLDASATAGHGGAAASNAGASGSGGAGASAIDPSFKTVQALIGSSCFGAGCHSEAGNPLQMEVGDPLYGTLTSYTTRTCGKLVDTAQPTESALVKLLQGSCNGVKRMPYGVCVEDGDPSCVLPEYIAAIQSWIAKGAPRQ
jgi:hypothetical protein